MSEKPTIFPESLKVVYKLKESGTIPELDKQITEVIEHLGFKWYAQGYNFETGERDIAFDPK